MVTLAETKWDCLKKLFTIVVQATWRHKNSCVQWYGAVGWV